MVIKMDEEKKELKEEKDSKEEALEKNFDEQKKVSQSDINNIKRSLQEIRNDLVELKNISDLGRQKITRIESILEKSEIEGKTEKMRTYSANFWYALSGSCITIGAVCISIGYTVSSTISNVNTLYGSLMVVIGLSILVYALFYLKKSIERGV